MSPQDAGSRAATRADSEGRQTFGKSYTCRLQAPRACAHYIADDIHKDTRALDGVAQTKIAFASDRHGTRVSGRPGQTVAASKEIYVTDYDGANQMRVTVNNGQASVSAGGAPRSVAYWRRRICASRSASERRSRSPGARDGSSQTWRASS